MRLLADLRGTPQETPQGCCTALYGAWVPQEGTYRGNAGTLGSAYMGEAL